MKRSLLRLFAILLLTTITVSYAEAKRVRVPKMYMFGFAASFNDTIVHFTNVIEVDSVWIESKKKFLIGREQYSNQLRNYLESKEQLPNRTCVVQFAKKKDKAEKKLLKMKHLYTNTKRGATGFDVRYIDDSFKFKAINIMDYEQ
jgi:hypothetical protein